MASGDEVDLDARLLHDIVNHAYYGDWTDPDEHRQSQDEFPDNWPDLRSPRFMNNPMFKAAEQGRWDDVRSMLLNNPEARNWVNELRWYEHVPVGTTLHQGCDAGEVEVVKLLLHAGARQDLRRARDITGWVRFLLLKRVAKALYLGRRWVLASRNRNREG
jgi:hypothetical protein